VPGRCPLLVIDEVGYIPFEADAADLFFQLASARYERASLIVTSNKPFGRRGEVFGDEVVAAAIIDRLVHHAEAIALKVTPTGSKTETLAAFPPPRPTNNNNPKVVSFSHGPSADRISDFR
jgi:hypothetical protein